MCDKQMYQPAHAASFTPTRCHSCGKFTLFPDWKEEEKCQHCGKVVKRKCG